MRRLEIGGGDRALPDYEQINEGWGFAPLPFPDCTFDEVYSSHCIEHIPWFLTDRALADAFRVLKPGGTIEIHTVDFGYLVECYRLRVCGDDWTARGQNPNHDPMKWLASRIFSVGAHPGDPNWHRAIFDADHLRKRVGVAGFLDIRMCEPRDSFHGPINLGVRARRPA